VTGGSCEDAQLGWLEQDATGSYYDAIAEIGKRVRDGAPIRRPQGYIQS
jgi:hypothetical protein